MAFDLHLVISESSPVGQIVQRLVMAEQITPEQAVTRLLTEMASREADEDPAEQLIGAFSSPEDREIMDRAMESAKAYRRRFDRIREMGA